MATLTSNQRNAMPDSSFAYVDSDGEGHLPINDAAHVRAAMARFNQTHFESDADKVSAHGKIAAAAKKFGIDVESFAEPDAGDVHVPVPVNSEPAVKKSAMLKRLTRSLKSHFKEHPALSEPQFSIMYRQARSHAGGMAKAGKYDEPADWHLCGHCAGLGHADPGPDCGCPECEDGDFDDCLCDAVEDEQGLHQGMNAHQFGDAHVIATDTGDALRLFLPLKFVDDGWIPYLPASGFFNHPRYGQVEMSRDRNADFVGKFASGVYQKQIPIDGEHDAKVSGAMAWVKQMRQNTDGSVDAYVEWTDRGKKMVEAGRYKYVSPEFWNEWEDPLSGEKIQNVAIGGALTTRPFFKESSLRPLVASELVPSRPAAEHSTQENTMTEPVKLNEEQIKAFREADPEYKKLRKATEEATSQIEKMSENHEVEKQSFTDRITALETAARRREYSERAKDWRGDVAEHISLMESLDDEKRESYAIARDKDAVAFAEAAKEAKIFSAVGTAGQNTDSALGQLNAVVVQMRENDPKLTAAQAFARALKGHPELYNEYQAEMNNFVIGTPPASA